MKCGRQLCRSAILLIHTVEETLNGKGYDTEEIGQEKASQDAEGKARRQDCQEERLTESLRRPFRRKQHPLRPSTCVSSEPRTLMVALRGLDPPLSMYLVARCVETSQVVCLSASSNLPF